MEFRNESGLDFVDVSSEESRVYSWGDGKAVAISAPLKLHVSASGGHRIFDASGQSHYIPAGWVHLSWKTKTGAPHFVK